MCSLCISMKCRMYGSLKKCLSALVKNPNLHTPSVFLCEANCAAYLTKPLEGGLINSSLQASFNYSVTRSVNGQNEIYYIILYISKLAMPKTGICGLQWLRTYMITVIWNWMHRHTISNTQLAPVFSVTSSSDRVSCPFTKDIYIVSSKSET